MTLPERLYTRPAAIHSSRLHATACHADVRFNSEWRHSQRAFDGVEPAQMSLRTRRSQHPSPSLPILAEPRRPSCAH